MSVKRFISSILILLLLMVITGCSKNDKKENASQKKEVSLLNVSYDPTREFYDEYNEAFRNYYEKKTGIKVSIDQSHGGSGKQARAVIEGLDADVVTLALAYDIDKIADAGLLSENWVNEFEDNSAPYTSTIVFLVRKGNPKDIKDWDDLIREDVSVITPNPKTSGGARWNYLAAYGYALKTNDNNEEKAQDFVKKLYANVEVLNPAARGATTTFVENNIGDVLISWENEAYLAIEELGADRFEIVVPSISILAEPTVAVVTQNAKKHGTEDIAKAYIAYMYSDEGQQIAAKNYYRPRSKSVEEKFKDRFLTVDLFTLADVFGDWRQTQETHFLDGGIFDQLYEGNN